MMPQRRYRRRPVCAVPTAAGPERAPREPLAFGDMTDAWTAPPVERIQPSRTGGEREALEQWLDFHRQTLLMKCAGLTSDQLKARTVPPSGLSLLGLVRHMVEVERWWFRKHAGDEQIGFVYCNDEEDCADFEDLEHADARSDLETFRREVEAAREAVRDKALDEVVPSRGHHPEQVRNIRWIYVHMLEEYARHNGHADLIRERIDGAVGD